MERQLYCKFMVDKLIMWNICPKDIRNLMYAHEYQLRNNKPQTDKENEKQLSYEELVNAILSDTNTSSSTYKDHYDS